MLPTMTDRIYDEHLKCALPVSHTLGIFFTKYLPTSLQMKNVPQCSEELYTATRLCSADLMHFSWQ